MPNKKWTDEDIEDLHRRVAAGQGVPLIARDIARSQEATRARMQMLGLTKPRRIRHDMSSPVAIYASERVADLAEQ